MLNDAQRTRLRIVMGDLEEKMRAVEQRLAYPEERRQMSEIRNDITTDAERALRHKIAEVHTLIGGLKDRFALPVEIKLASREILKGLPQLWVALQESNSKRLQGYGHIDPADANLLDADIKTLADMMFDLEQIVLPQRQSALSADEKEKVQEHRIAG